MYQSFAGFQSGVFATADPGGRRPCEVEASKATPPAIPAPPLALPPGTTATMLRWAVTALQASRSRPPLARSLSECSNPAHSLVPTSL